MGWSQNTLERPAVARRGLAHRLRANVAVIERRWPGALAELDASIASGIDVPGLRERRAQVAAMARAR